MTLPPESPPRIEPVLEPILEPVLEPVIAPPPAPPRPGAARPLLAALVTTIVVTAVSYLTPERYAATAVGVTFLAATWWLVLRRDGRAIRAHGLSLGGLLEPEPLEARRILRDALRAAAWAAGLAVIVFPAFWVGFRLYWHPHTHFGLRLPGSVFDEVAGQFVVIALPEEAFFRGYLQTALDEAWPPRLQVLGARLGPGLLVSAAIFAVGHLLTIRHPARLAVFFPALVFGWLRARTGGIGASVAFHATCNLFSAALMRGYGFG